MAELTILSYYAFIYNFEPVALQKIFSGGGFFWKILSTFFLGRQIWFSEPSENTIDLKYF